MPLAAIEIHDFGLLAVDASGRMLAPPSPGYAVVVANGDLRTGVEALESSRLRPRRTHHRFWSELDTAPLGRPFPEGLSAADLAHAHLSELWGRIDAGLKEVLLAVPGSLSENQLGILLGVARAAGIPAAGLVDAAVAAAASAPVESARLLHLDVQLHRTLLTEITRGEDLVRQSVKALAGTGLVQLQDAWSRRIAEIFVKSTRFDPLHAADTEQALFDCLPGVQDGLCRETAITLELPAARGTHSAELTRAELVETASTIYDAVARLVRSASPGEDTALLLSGTAAMLPGLEERLGAEGELQILTLPREAAAAGAVRSRETVRASGEELPFVTRLPVPGATAPGTLDATRTGSLAPPTHLLHEDQAYRITTEPFVLGGALPAHGRGLVFVGDPDGIGPTGCSLVRRGDRVTLQGDDGTRLSVNGEPVQGEVEVHAGDRLQIGARRIEIRLFRMMEPDG